MSIVYFYFVDSLHALSRRVFTPSRDFPNFYHKSLIVGLCARLRVGAKAKCPATAKCPARQMLK